MGETVLGNRYEIIKKIGDGGMAFVYEARDKLLNRKVALKVLRPEFVDDDEFLTKFKKEAEAVANLSHPNIVNIYDVGEDGKVHYIVMELVEGQNLKEIIKNEGTLDEYTAIDIIKQIAKALREAHRKGIVHRDIKPHNILISNEGRVVKVADFGIAKAVSNSTMTSVGSIIGSVHYFSPEQAKGKSVTNTADLYSLGIVLYEMLIGRVPFRGDSPIAIALQHINDELEFTQDEKVRIPQSVRTLIKKLTQKRSEDRYQSADELIDDIEYIEKNIDLAFIKEYDNYATQKVEMDNLYINKNHHADEDINELEYDEDDGYDEVEDEEMSRMDKKKKNKKQKQDSPKTKKKLTIAAVILSIILMSQVVLAYKFLFGGGSDSLELESPNLINMTLDEANRELDKLELDVLVRQEYSEEVEEGIVISQTPEAGMIVNKGDTITIVVSKGIKKSNAPDLIGMMLQEAENTLIAQGLKLGRISYDYSEKYAEGVVISQDPRNGFGNVEEGDSVNVVVSKGTAPTEEPEIEEPEVEIPDTERPNTGNPDTETPDVEEPDTETPDTETPDTETPDTETPDTETPDTETPDTETPDTETPDTSQPQ